MAAPVVRLRRSATQSAVPTTAQLALGEVAINTFDGKLFIKKNNGTESIVEIGAGGGGGISNVVEDTTPQLGGDLDSNGNNILLNDDKIVLGTSQNFIVGNSTTTGVALTTGNDNILIGDQSGQSLTIGDFNISIGDLAGSSNTDGNQNICIGRFAGSSHDGGVNNVFVGVNAGSSITSASYNVCIGEGAGEGANSGATGNHNVFLGSFASSSYTTGSENVSVGYIAGTSITEGQDNVSIGNGSGYSNTTGSSNIFIGKYGGISTTASNKVIIGNGFSTSFLFDAPDTTSNEQLAIGNRTSSGAAKYWIVGDENYNVGIGIDPTERLDVQGNIKATSFIKSGGTASQYLMADGSVTSTTVEHKILDDISGSFNGSTTSFTLSSSSTNFINSEITSAARLMISVGGVVQQPDPTQTSGFYISGGTNISTDPIVINFVEAPKAGQDFFGVAYGLTISPSEAFVTEEQSIVNSIVFGV